MTYDSYIQLATCLRLDLKDQSLALKRIYENVHLFGGDNDRITIAGQSAGGSSVGWQLLSDKSQSKFLNYALFKHFDGCDCYKLNIFPGLFRAAIIESGSPLNTWAYQNDLYGYAI
ncbi:hypothetical protein HUJ04_011123 [Dendroctonus ponderosae]|nr:hypothetical protein HUJ04_011123 [Dendroctonus ponderosae]